MNKLNLKGSKFVSLIALGSIVAVVVIFGVFLFRGLNPNTGINQLPNTFEPTPGEVFSGPDFIITDRPIDPETDITTLPNGNVQVEFCYDITNNRDRTATNVDVTSSLTDMFDPIPFELVEIDVTGAVPNPDYDGDGNTEVIAPGQSIEPGETITVCFTVEFDPADVTEPIENEISVDADFPPDSDDDDIDGDDSEGSGDDDSGDGSDEPPADGGGDTPGDDDDDGVDIGPPSNDDPEEDVPGEGEPEPGDGDDSSDGGETEDDNTDSGDSGAEDTDPNEPGRGSIILPPLDTLPSEGSDTPGSDSPNVEDVSNNNGNAVTANGNEAGTGSGTVTLANSGFNLVGMNIAIGFGSILLVVGLQLLSMNLNRFNRNEQTISR